MDEREGAYREGDLSIVWSCPQLNRFFFLLLLVAIISEQSCAWLRSKSDAYSPWASCVLGKQCSLAFFMENKEPFLWLCRYLDCKQVRFVDLPWDGFSASQQSHDCFNISIKDATREEVVSHCFQNQ